MHPVVYNSKAALTARKVLDKLGSFYLEKYFEMAPIRIISK